MHVWSFRLCGFIYGVPMRSRLFFAILAILTSLVIIGLGSLVQSLLDSLIASLDAKDAHLVNRIVHVVMLFSILPTLLLIFSVFMLLAAGEIEKIISNRRKNEK